MIWADPPQQVRRGVRGRNLEGVDRCNQYGDGPRSATTLLEPDSQTVNTELHNGPSPPLPIAGVPQIRKSQGNVKLTHEEFNRRLGERFYGRAFPPVRKQIEQVMEVAWKNYDEYHRESAQASSGA